MFQHKKKYGQNFLKNNSIAHQIVSGLNIYNKNILEIGPGNLALTKLILEKKPKKFLAIEIDEEIIKKHKNFDHNIDFINHNALEFDEIKNFNKLNFSIISNLPFNISAELLIKWIYLQNYNNCIDEMILMFQEELADRIISSENSKKYGRITILANSIFEVKEHIYVNKSNFFPKPKVNAKVIKFTKLKVKKIKSENLLNLEKITKIFFNSRRKKIEKNIQKLFSNDDIKKNNFDRLFNLRPENLRKEIYYKMSEII